MCLHHVEVCTHLYMVQDESPWKCELRNWGDVPGDNLWSDSATGDSGGLVVSITECYVVRIESHVNGIHPGGAALPSGRK